MLKRNKWIEIECPTVSTHWTLQYKIPASHEDPWYWAENYKDSYYRSALMFGFYKFFIRVSLWKTKPLEVPCGEFAKNQYGLTLFDRGLHVHFGDTTVYDLPWSWEIVRHDLLLPGGEVYYSNRYTNNSPRNWTTWFRILNNVDEVYSQSDVTTNATETVKITHYLKDGSAQDATITLTGNEHEWRWKWFKWLPYPRIINRVVVCNSDIELGERAGSWKGGLMGWSYEWRKDESMTDAFYRWYKEWNGI